MSHDVFGLGIARRLLMQKFHSRHAFPFFGGLDSIGENHDARGHLKWAEQSKAEANPAGSKRVQIKALTVEEMEKAMIGLAAKVQDTDEARDFGVVSATTQAHQDESQPEEGM